MIAVVSALVAAGSMLPQGGAIPIPILDAICSDQDGPDAEVSAQAGATFANWKPACVRIDNAGRVKWTNNDPVTHQPGNINCFDGGRIGVLEPELSTSIRYTYDPANDRLLLSVNGLARVCPRVVGADVNFVVSADRIDLHYWCLIHGDAAMPGDIVIQR